MGVVVYRTWCPTTSARAKVTKVMSDTPGPMGSHLGQLAAALATPGLDPADHDGRPAALRIVHAARDLIHGAPWVSITVLRHNQFATSAATNEQARHLDLLQYELDAGPWVDAVRDGTAYGTANLPADRRWPQFAHQAGTEYGVHSILSYPLQLSTRLVKASLNLYSTRAEAFTQDDIATGSLLAVIAAHLTSAEIAHEEIIQLRQGLESNREIGRACGIIMARRNLTRDQAFDLLCEFSQRANRKLREIATTIVDTGTFEPPAIATHPPVTAELQTSTPTR